MDSEESEDSSEEVGSESGSESSESEQKVVVRKKKVKKGFAF